MPAGKGKKPWSSNVTTESTFPEKGIFTKDAKTIARHMASKKVSPKGIGSGIRMIQYFINRAGKGLPASRKRELKQKGYCRIERQGMKSSLCILLKLINPMFGNFNCMTAEPTSLGLSVIVAGAIAFAIWFLRKTRLKRGKAERKRRLEIAR